MIEPFGDEEGAVWNLLLFCCINSNGATLEELTRWFYDYMSEAELYIALSGLLHRKVIGCDEGRYYPKVDGQRFQNTQIDWDELSELAIIPGRTIH
jgi:hypothetical protein